MRDLLPPRCGQQTQMHPHHPKGANLRVKLDPHSPPGLQPRQIMMPGSPHADLVAAPDHRIAMPAQTARAAQIDDLPTLPRPA